VKGVIPDRRRQRVLVHLKTTQQTHRFDLGAHPTLQARTLVETFKAHGEMAGFMFRHGRAYLRLGLIPTPRGCGEGIHLTTREIEGVTQGGILRRLMVSTARNLVVDETRGLRKGDQGDQVAVQRTRIRVDIETAMTNSLDEMEGANVKQNSRHPGHRGIAASVLLVRD
jgi:hypothetical protein